MATVREPDAGLALRSERGVTDVADPIHDEHASAASTPMPEIDEGKVRAALDRVLHSGQFEKTKRASQFLRYIVEETIAGRADRLKGYTIATEVFGRGADFDPDNDTIVRVQAGQVRRRLSLYYADDGRKDSVRIVVPKGSYTPEFRDGAAAPDDAPAAGGPGELSLPRGPSIAVLPFADLSAERECAHFAEGIAAEIINDLTKFRDLLVMASHATFRYRGPHVDVQRLGEELGVEYALAGSVRSAGNRIRVMAQLVDVASNAHVFSDQFDEELTPRNILDLQEKIADNVVAKVAEPYGVIARLGRHRARRNLESGVDSYGCVLRYYRFEANPTPEEHARLRDLLEEVTANDPEYASAWAALAAIHLDEIRLNFNPRRDRPALPLALDAAEKAVRIDPESSMAHHFLFCARFHDGDLRGFSDAGDRAIKLNPNHPDMLADYGLYRVLSGDWEGGLPLARKALSLSAFPPGWYHTAFVLDHYRMGRFEEALADAMRLKSPRLFHDPLLRAICHARLGDRAEARSCLAELETIFPAFRSRATDVFARLNVHPALVATLIDGLDEAVTATA